MGGRRGLIVPSSNVTTETEDLSRADAIVPSACVPMPSRSALTAAQRWTGSPTQSAATATARALLAGRPAVAA